MPVPQDEKRKKVERLALYGALALLLTVGLIVVGMYHLFKAKGFI
jgi:predicted nucleic acid-binding Zn ribbon protein